jgi:ribosomal protein L16 Arg81 hydroxylase
MANLLFILGFMSGLSFQLRKLQYLTDLKPLRISRILQYCSSGDPEELDGWDSSTYPHFLRRYWQKRPVLIRNAIPIASKVFNYKDLLLLATNPDVESRLVRQLKEGRKPTKSYGPFQTDIINELLIRSNWTLFIQEVDRHIPRVADLWIQYFDFIPNWRRDDVMVSYSGTGGGIGGHVDNYDVFLVQGRSNIWTFSVSCFRNF